MIPDSPSDEDLFAGVQSRDSSSWEIFVDRFGPLIASVPTRAGLPGDQVDDVVQATWMQLLKHAKSIRVPKSIPAWILTTAARETWRLGSRERARRSIEFEGARDEFQEPADIDLVHLERVQVVRDSVAQMGKRCRILLNALFLETNTPRYEDLAKDLGIAIGSIGPTRQRCLARLAQELSRNGVDWSGDGI